MGDFSNLINGTTGPRIPLELADKIESRSQIDLTAHEAELFTIALYGVRKQLIDENKDFKKLYKATVLCTVNGEYSFSDTEGMGYYMRLIVFNVGNWREDGWSDLHILATYVEEFCHHYWHIFDEEEVKLKVILILNKILNFEVTFEQLYGPDWKLAYPEDYPNEK